MDKQPRTREQRKQEIRRGKTFAACILLCFAIPGWVEAALGWWKLWANA